MVLRIGLALTFVGFGIWILFQITRRTPKEPSWGAYATTTVTFFLAEMGDKTQLATIALGAQFGSFWMVTLGTTLGILFSDGLAVLLGEKFALRFP